MASTYSTNLGLEKQGDGENANTWGLRLNQNVIDLVDQAVTGYSVITLTSGVQTSLTIPDGLPSSGRSSSIEFVGFIDADTTVVVPALEKTYFVFNSITGSGNIYLKNSGGSTLTTVTSVGKGMYVATDGTNIRTLSEVDDGPILANASAISVLDSTTYKNNVENTVSAGTFTFLEDVVLSFNVSTSANPYRTQMFHTGLFQIIDTNTALIINDSTRTSGTTRFAFDVASGSFTAAGDVTAFSDERLKSNIKTLDGSKVFDMRGVSFTKDKKESSGVIAQELEKIAPELVNSTGEYKSVAYGNIVGYLIEAVKQLKKEIEELKENK